jgi:DNA polymerase III subunit delta
MAELTPHQVLAELSAGVLRPAYAVVGPERFWSQAVLKAIRVAALGGPGPSMNEDVFDAAEHDVETVLRAARTLPMFGVRRLVWVRSVERWEPKGSKTEGAKPESAKAENTKAAAQPLDRVADVLGAPIPSTVLVFLADEADNRRRWITQAKQAGCLVACSHPRPNELRRFVREQAEARGHQCAGRSADLLGELIGPDCSALDSAVERLSLYAGKGQPITEEAVLECIAQVSGQTVWQLVDAVGRRDIVAALRALQDNFEPGSGPRLVGLLCWSARQVIRFASASARGLPADQAAKEAGVPPFKVREIESQARALSLPRAEAWLEALYDLDLDLKGRSRLPQRVQLEQALFKFCMN